MSAAKRSAESIHRVMGSFFRHGPNCPCHGSALIPSVNALHPLHSSVSHSAFANVGFGFGSGFSNETESTQDSATDFGFMQSGERASWFHRAETSALAHSRDCQFDKSRPIIPPVQRVFRHKLIHTSSQAAHIDSKELSEYAFEMATSSIRFGKGVTAEVGLDMVDWKCKKVLVVTDSVLSKLKPVKTVIESLERNKIQYSLYDKASVEPTDVSFKDAIAFAEKVSFDAVIAVGGGSVMDTAKVANLYTTYPASFLDYVNPPIGKGIPVPGPCKPLVAIPTTAGTGSEATGTAIFDFLELKAKTGIAHRHLKPTLGIIDPENTESLPPEVATASGFDVLCHALESYTAIPFYQRTPRPARPLLRPAYQGSNPISDHWSMKSLEMMKKYFVRAVEDPSDEEARSNMLLAATFAGIGFGNAGVHLCHGMSYPVSGGVRDYMPPGYQVNEPMIPHGISVVLHAPAVFRFTAPTDPKRHLDAASALGANTERASPESAGEILSEQVIKYMHRLRVPNGLEAVGFTKGDIPDLVKGTLPQHRVTKLSPKPAGEEELGLLFESSMKIW